MTPTLGTNLVSLSAFEVFFRKPTYLVSIELQVYVSTKLYVTSVIFKVATKNSLMMPMTQMLWGSQSVSFSNKFVPAQKATYNPPSKNMNDTTTFF
jgi:hypothetical protein